MRSFKKQPAACWAPLILMLIGTAGPSLAQSTFINPDCVVPFIFTASGQFTPIAPNNCSHNLGGIVEWTMTYGSQGFTGVSIIVQSAPDNAGVPGTWVTFVGTVSSGTNPLTSTNGGYVQLLGYNPWNRVFLTTATGGPGQIQGTLYGCRQPGCGAGTGSGSSTACGTGTNPPCVQTNQCAGTTPTAVTLSSSGLTQIAAASAGKQLVVCDLLLSFATVPTSVTLEYGTGSNCGVGTTAWTGAMPNVATMAVDVAFTLPASNALCVNLGSSVTGDGFVEFTYQ